MVRDNTQPADKQEVEMTEGEEAVVDDIWADLFWTSVAEKKQQQQPQTKLGRERERQRKQEGMLK